MAWTGTVVSVRENPVPNDTVWVTAQFSDGARTFSKEYKFTAGGEDVTTFIAARTAEVAELYASIPDLTQLVISDVPQRVSMFQARAVLLAQGLLDGIEAALKAQGGVSYLAWEYSTTVQRQSPLVLAMAQMLKLSDEQMDQMFVAASQVAV